MSSLFSIKLSNREKLIFTLLFIIGIILRFWILDASFSYDEMYTVKTYFLHHSWWGALARYNLPNNHFLNTLLGHLSLNIFTLNHFSVRFFPFAFGILLIPLTLLITYSMTKNRSQSLFLSAVVAFGFPFVEYSSMARGYIFQCFFSLILIYFLNTYKNHNNNSKPWLISLIFSVSVFSLPFTFILFPLCLFCFDNKYSKFKYVLIQIFLLLIFFFIPAMYVVTGKLKHDFNYSLAEKISYIQEMFINFHEDFGLFFLVYFIFCLVKVFARSHKKKYLVYSPLLMMLLLRWFPPFFRNYLFLIVPVILLFFRLKQNLKYQKIIYFLIPMSLLVNSFYNIRTRVLAPGRNYQKAYEYLSTEIRPGDLVAGFYSPLQSTLFYSKLMQDDKKFISVFQNKGINIFEYEGSNIFN